MKLPDKLLKMFPDVEQPTKKQKKKSKKYSDSQLERKRKQQNKKLGRLFNACEKKMYRSEEEAKRAATSFTVLNGNKQKQKTHNAYTHFVWTCVVGWALYELYQS